MLIKSLTFALIALISLYSAETNAAQASQTITANKCTIGLLPFGTTLAIDTKKDAIIKAYEARGFHVSVLTSPSEISDVEYISDASIECTSTYFGIMAKTTVRLIETQTDKIIFRAISPAKIELFNCNIDLFSAISALPSCQIK